MISNQKRTYLTEDEADRLIKAARAEGRQGVRDHALLLVAYRHGLRASEALALAVASSRLESLPAAHSSGEEWHPCRAPDPRPDVAGFA